MKKNQLYPTDLTDRQWDCIKELIPVLATYDIRREIDSLPHQLTDLLTTNKLISRSLGYILVSQT